MWLDDDGDEPIGGEIPDPSTRHWRHPSEIAAEAAKAAAEFGPIVPEGATQGVVTSAHGSSATSILWPITVVGGCIAIAALGVVGLYLTGAADVDELQVASATTINPTGSDLTALSRPEEPSLGNRVSGGDTDFSDEERLDGLGSDRTTVPKSTTTSVPPSTTSTTAPASTTTSLAPEVLPQQRSTLVGPAVYASADAGAQQLASVILTEGYLLTSASAMAGHTDVSLLVGEVWIDAVVSHLDPLSDVAVLTMVDPSIQPPMPISIRGETMDTGVDVFLGYCKSEMAAPVDLDRPKLDPDEAQEWGTTASEPGCNPVVAASPPSRDALAEAAPEPNPDDGQAESEEPEAGQTDPGGTGTETPEPKAEDGQGPETEADETTPRPAKPHQSDRKGKIYSLDQTLMTLAGRYLYDPIRTGIPQEPPVAGSPLRDHEGRVVGLVVAAASPNVAAVPIDRAVAVARSMVETGLASPAWIGIEVTSTSSGVEVNTVEVDGPADGKLQIGDLIDRVNGDVVIEADYLEHLTRKAGPGKALVVRFVRDGERQQAVIRIGSLPTD